MKAVVYDRYGPPDVQRIEDVERPVPKADEVLVKVRATTVNRLDVHTREANRRSGLAVSLLSRLVSGVRRQVSSPSVTTSSATAGSGSGRTPSSCAYRRAAGSPICRPG